MTVCKVLGGRKGLGMGQERVGRRGRCKCCWKVVSTKKKSSQEHGRTSRQMDTNTKELMGQIFSRNLFVKL